MKYGIAIVWEGPEELPRCNEHYATAMRTMVSQELAHINRRFTERNLKTLTFQVFEMPVASLNKIPDC